MQGFIHEYLKIGLISFMAYPECSDTPAPSLLERMKKIACDSFFDVIEVNPFKSELQRIECTEIFQQSHAEICYGAQARLLSSGLNPNDLDEKKRIQAEKTLLAGVDEAVSVGAKRMAFLAGAWTEETKDTALKQLLKTTAAVCDYGKKRDVFIELEIFDFDIAKKSLIGPSSLAAKFAGAVREKTDNFGLLVDLSHIPMMHESSESVLKALRPYITHFHAGNTVIKNRLLPAYGDEHPRFGFKESENDTRELIVFLQILQKEGFFNKENPFILSFEVKPRPEEDADVVIANTKRVLNRALSMIEFG